MNHYRSAYSKACPIDKPENVDRAADVWVFIICMFAFVGYVLQRFGIIF